MATKPASRPGHAPVVYRRILVPLVGGRESKQAVSIACELAVEHGAAVIALRVIEVEPDLPLDAHMVEEEIEARQMLAEARAIGDLYGVSVVPRTVKARAAGQEIVAEAARARTEVIVLRAARKKRYGRRARVFGGTVDYVLTHAPCRVMVAAPPPAS
jgi:basic amino acid/polyamine antiporter, APA family